MLGGGGPGVYRYPRLGRRLTAPPARPTYTPAMRRMIFVAALVRKLSGQAYIWTARPLPRPVPIVRQLPVDPRNGTRPAWWTAR